MADIKVQVANPLAKQVKQVSVGKLDASTTPINSLMDVDTTTVTLQSGSTLIYDGTTNKFEAANTIDGGTY
jgi:TRAP-type C4-dicarboxylate transport system substrate-binding protein